MDVIRIESVEEPFTEPEAARAASILLGRAETMGLLAQIGTISRLDIDTMDKVLHRLGQAGLMQRAVIGGAASVLRHDQAGIVRLLTEANAALEDSAVPEQEWDALRSTLGDSLLARLCRISETSLHRYTSGSRTTPDPIAQRLHTLALIVADLRGAYNDFGIRRWFQRPRAQLEGYSPEQYLPTEWSPESPEVGEIRRLAVALAGSPAT